MLLIVATVVMMIIRESHDMCKYILVHQCAVCSDHTFMLELNFNLPVLIIIMTLNGTNQGFLQSFQCAANCLYHIHSCGQGAVVQITSSASGACHMQHVVCHMVRRDSSAIKFDRVEWSHFSKDGRQKWMMYIRLASGYFCQLNCFS